MPVEVIVEEAAVAVEEEVAAAAEAGAVAAVAAAAAVVEAEVAEAEVVTMMTMMMGHLSVYQVPPIVERDVEFSTIKKWNNSLKSYKINDRWPLDDGSQASRLPIPSPPRIRMDGIPPSHADRRVYETKRRCYEVKSTGSLDSSLTASIIY